MADDALVRNSIPAPIKFCSRFSPDTNQSHSNHTNPAAMFWRRKKGADGEAAGAPGGAAAKGPRIDLNKVSKRKSSTQLRALLDQFPLSVP